MVYALSWITSLLTMIKNEFIGFKSIKDMYKIDKDFCQVMAYLRSPTMANGDLYRDYFLYEVYLFKG